MSKLTQCLKDHVEPTNEIISAMKEVEESFEKTSSFQKFTTWISLFLSSFLIPLSVMVSDMSFDNILVFGPQGYVQYLVKTNDTLPLPNVTNLCYEVGNSSRDSEKFSRLTSLQQKIPSGLTGKPIFGYSLTFIVLPWCFYFIEFLHSRHREKAAFKVSI